MINIYLYFTKSVVASRQNRNVSLFSVCSFCGKTTHKVSTWSRVPFSDRFFVMAGVPLITILVIALERLGLCRLERDRRENRPHSVYHRDCER